MAADYWDSSVRNLGHIEDDEEEWTPNVRPEPAGAGGSTFQFGHEEELARQRELEEAEERERERERELQERVAFHAEQERLRRRVAAGETRVIDLRKK